MALYFAAIDAVKDSKNLSGDFAMWVLQTESVNAHRTADASVQVVEVAGATSRNLGAQAGLFTLVQEKFDRNAKLAVPPRVLRIDQVLAMSGGARGLHKIIAPRSLAPLMLNLCEQHGVTASTLFPGPDGAVREVMDGLSQSAFEQALLDSADRHRAGE